MCVERHEMATASFWAILQVTATLNAVDDEAKIEKSCCYIFDPIHSYPACHAPVAKNASLIPESPIFQSTMEDAFLNRRLHVRANALPFLYANTDGLSHRPSHGCNLRCELSCNNNCRRSDTWQQLAHK